ncbi:hypothetical protein Q73_07650 [Bacillus coahuilensis m2-6]|uniref:YpmS family protein n=1 Tax=Bacillus coahuilensis TaxID=408580 RepID=UPI0001850D1C|nr:YpmS family protein [Bacillus coahuilensis]KUP07973.1 hypothetical protein Q73_07650 [Bacillus coahuilensis m2-6]
MKKNKWKAAFFTLLLTVLSFCTVFILLLTVSFDEPVEREIVQSYDAKIPVEIQLTKDSLNQIIQKYLEDEGLTETFQYNVSVEDQLLLEGDIAILSSTIPFQLKFEPTVTEDGDIQLINPSIIVGNISLPEEYVLRFIARSYDLPEFVNIDYKNETVNLYVTSMNIQNNISVKANQFDLATNNISFTLYLPSENE